MGNKQQTGSPGNADQDVPANEPGRTAGGPLPGDAIEGSRPPGGTGGRIDPAEADAEMRRREAETGPRRAGQIGEARLGTPAGGVTRAAETGSAPWGKPAEEQENEPAQE